MLLVGIALLGGAIVLKAGVRDRLYDFTDAYYLQNGINLQRSMGGASPGHSP